MSCYSLASVSRLDEQTAQSRRDEPDAADGPWARSGARQTGAAGEARPRLWQRVLRLDFRLDRLDLETLSEHHLRDLGFIDGRAAPPRDPLRD